MNVEDFRKKKELAKKSFFIKFKEEGEVKYLRFLDANILSQAHLKAFDQETKKYIYDEDIPEGTEAKVSIVLRLNVVEYSAAGGEGKKCVWEFSEFLWNKFAKAYVEDPDMGAVPNNVWKVKVTAPGTLDVAYAFIKINATLDTHPIPVLEEVEEVEEEVDMAQPPFKTNPVPPQSPPFQEVKKNRYFE